MSKARVLIPTLRFVGVIAPGLTARFSRRLFRTPHIAPVKAWEIAVQERAQRRYLSNGVSYLQWSVDRPVMRVIAMHGWEGRATQWGPLAERLSAQHIEVIALDGPGHGHSTGRRADPVLFSNALLTAERELGPFDAALGHSMGAGSVVFALYRGLVVKRIVYIAGPASFKEVVQRFARHFGLPERAQRAFLTQIERANKARFTDADVMPIAQLFSVPALIVHDTGDDDVPYHDAERLHQTWTSSTLLTTQGLGHKRILRDPAVMEQIADFLTAAN